MARWGLIGTIVLMGVALLSIVWLTNQNVHDASQTLIRGQSSALVEIIHARFRELGRPPTEEDLNDIVEEFSENDLRYLAILNKRGQIKLEGGTPCQEKVLLERWLDAFTENQAIEIDNCARILLPRRNRLLRKPKNRFSQPKSAPSSLLIEFIPSHAINLRQTATGNLVIGVITAITLLLFALMLVRWFIKQDRMAKQQEHKRRLASLGEMSGVMAHEIRNPLASLKGHAQLLEESISPQKPEYKKVSRIIKEAIRIETLTSRILRFVRIGNIQRTPTSPTQLVKDILEELQIKNILLDTNQAPETWPLDQEQMRQVFLNLLQNAQQATKEPCDIFVSIKIKSNSLLFEIRDQGTGIQAGDESKIFTPFYTTRTQGTGLGLAIARQIVTLHGGDIVAKNHAKGGAVFQVFIPKTT